MADVPSHEALIEMARISGLTLDAATLARIMPELDALIRNIQALEKLDLSDIEPATTFQPTRLNRS